MLKIIKLLYIKWVKGECRHLCICCDFKHECHEHFNNPMVK